MSPITTAKSQSPSNTIAKAATDPQKPAGDVGPKAEAPTVLAAPTVDTKPLEAPAPEPQAALVAETAGRPDTRTILSLTVPEKLARQIRLLARVEGVTISQLVLESVEKTVPTRLKAALAAIVED